MKDTVVTKYENGTYYFENPRFDVILTSDGIVKKSKFLNIIEHNNRNIYPVTIDGKKYYKTFSAIFKMMNSIEEKPGYSLIFKDEDIGWHPNNIFYANKTQQKINKIIKKNKSFVIKDVATRDDVYDVSEALNFFGFNTKALMRDNIKNIVCKNDKEISTNLEKISDYLYCISCNDIISLYKLFDNSKIETPELNDEQLLDLLNENSNHNENENVLNLLNEDNFDEKSNKITDEKIISYGLTLVSKHGFLSYIGNLFDTKEDALKESLLYKKEIDVIKSIIDLNLWNEEYVYIFYKNIDHNKLCRHDFYDFLKSPNLYLERESIFTFDPDEWKDYRSILRKKYTRTVALKLIDLIVDKKILDKKIDILSAEGI